MLIYINVTICSQLFLIFHATRGIHACCHDTRGKQWRRDMQSLAANDRKLGYMFISSCPNTIINSCFAHECTVT